MINTRGPAEVSHLRPGRGLSVEVADTAGGIDCGTVMIHAGLDEGLVGEAKLLVLCVLALGADPQRWAAARRQPGGVLLAAARSATAVCGTAALCWIARAIRLDCAWVRGSRESGMAAYVQADWDWLRRWAQARACTQGAGGACRCAVTGDARGAMSPLRGYPRSDAVVPRSGGDAGFL